MSDFCPKCFTRADTCADCTQAEIEGLKGTIKDLEKERDDLLDAVDKYRTLIMGWSADMQYELRGMK